MPVSDLLRQAIHELEKLPIEDQDKVAARWLDELKDEQAWGTAFATTTDTQWDQLVTIVKGDITSGDMESLDDFLNDLKTG